MFLENELFVINTDQNSLRLRKPTFEIDVDLLSISINVFPTTCLRYQINILNEI